MEVKSEKLQSLQDVEFFSLNNLQQSININGGSDIGRTLLVDGNNFASNTEVECDIKKEIFPFNVSDNADKVCKEYSRSTQEENSPFPNANENQSWGSFSLNNVQQSGDIKVELGIDETLSLDGNEFATNAEVECLNKSELSPVDEWTNEYNEYDDESHNFREDNSSSDTNEEENGTSNGAPSISVECTELGCHFGVGSTSQAANVRSHLKTIHHKMKDLKCQYCDYSTSRALNRERHIKTIHFKIKNFKCQYCDYSASEAATLRDHITAIHHKIKDLKCEYCDYSTSRTSTLRRHIKAVHHKIKD